MYDVIEEGQRCVCHNMHLVVCSALDDAVVKPLVTKARALAHLFKNSQIFRDALAHAQKQRYEAHHDSAPLVQMDKTPGDAAEDVILEPEDIPRPTRALMDCATRWWSCWRMLVRVCELKEDITRILDSVGRDQEDLSPAEWSDLALMCRILRPFSDVIREWEGEKYVTLSRVWPLAVGLKHALERNVLTSQDIAAEDRLPPWSTVTSAKFPASHALRYALKTELAHDIRFGDVSMVMKLATHCP